MRQPQRVQHRGVLGLLDEPGDPEVFVHLHDAEAGDIFAFDGDRGHGDIGGGVDMLGNDRAEVHPVELVAAQHDQVIKRMVQQMNQVLAHRVRGPLVPRGVRQRLLRGQDLHETVRELVELVRLRDMAVERCGVELREQVDPLQAGVDAVRYRDVHQTILARQRHRRLRPLLRQRKEPRARATAEDDRKHAVGAELNGLHRARHRVPFACQSDGAT